ncbi:hypothetical protein ACQEVX_05070 [Streptomyces syringium]|uniref:hypothetical protein n=1 Tax=Streptomyces syringium TaxID=76729 RepID=UPI003D8B7D1D
MISHASITEALRTMLEEAVGKPCGRGALPSPGGKPAPLPYLVLYPLGVHVGGAPLADLSEDATLIFQVTVVASRTDQAEWLADRVRAGVLDRASSGQWVNPILLPAGEVWARELLADEGADQSSADDGVVTYVQQYRLSASL